MSTLSVLVERHGSLSGADLEWLHLLVGDWQVASDLAFADLVLWLPTTDGDFVAVAQCRPSTGATVHYDDVVGSRVPEGQRPQLRRSLDERRQLRSREPRWFGSYAVREEAVPVVRDGRAIAVIARQTNLGGARTPSRLELNYVEAADDIFAMIANGEFPAPDAPTGPRRGAPRVGDGLVRLNSEGEVLYASPNALSCFHRLGVLGSLVGQSLAQVTTALLWLVFAAYVLVRRYGSTGSERLAAALAIFGGVNVPIIYYAVKIWKTTHPSNEVVGSLPPEMWGAFWPALGAVLMMSLGLAIVRVRQERTEMALDDAWVEVDDRARAEGGA